MGMNRVLLLKKNTFEVIVIILQIKKWLHTDSKIDAYIKKTNFFSISENRLELSLVDIIVTNQ